MSKVLIYYLLRNFLKTLLIVILVIYAFGIILNLFEEIEFFKNETVNLFLPLMLTSIFVPSIIIKLLPFIIFVASMWFMVKIRNNKDLLTLKVLWIFKFKNFFYSCLFIFYCWFTYFIYCKSGYFFNGKILRAN